MTVSMTGQLGDVFGGEPGEVLRSLLDHAASLVPGAQAAVSLVDAGRVRTVATTESDLLRAGPDEALTSHLVSGDEALIVPDTRLDARFAGRACPVTARFYAGHQLVGSGATVLGVLSVWHEHPQDPGEAAVRSLARTARYAAAVVGSNIALFERDRDRAILAATGRVLKLITDGAELRAVLRALVRAVEHSVPDTIGSILLLDGDVLRHGAMGARLPNEFQLAIDGEPIGPFAGSCGTAAFTGETVIVSDIATDERWRDYRGLALRHGLRACWSVPVMAADGQSLGTFALYYKAVRVPSQRDVDQIERWASVASLAITRARHAQALRSAATHDPLTGLPNRTELLQKLATAHPSADRGVGVLFVDLDQFKFVNDTFGHQLGDQFLRATARRLTSAVGDENVVSRFGGDEFLVFCSALDESQTASRLAHRIVDSLRQPMSLQGHTLSMSASVGVATAFDADARPMLDLIGDADLAMYAAKRAGRNSVAMFTSSLRRSAAQRLSLEAELALALANGEIECAYQPSVDLRTGAVRGVEALARWASPTRGPVPPLEFIPVAEDGGLIHDVGARVLRLACAQLARWRQVSPVWQDVRVWVNVSARQLTDMAILDVVDRVLAETSVPPSALGIEVTESCFMDAAAVARAVLAQLRELGILIAIDDFGTGYSSLSQLRQLPVDVLKIDRQFVSDMREDGRIVDAILTLAGALDLAVVAEGIETAEQCEQLSTSGCAMGQGYLWSRPVTGAELTDRIAAVKGRFAV